MKLSVSMTDEEVAFVDRYAAAHQVASRSGVIQRSLALLRASELGDEYEAAWAEWDEGDGPLWDRVTSDGLS